MYHKRLNIRSYNSLHKLWCWPSLPHSYTVFLYCWPCYHPEYSWNTTHWMLSNNQSLNKYLDSNNLYFLSFIFSNSGHFGRSTGWRSIILKETAHKKKLWKMVRLDFPHVSTLCSVLEHNDTKKIIRRWWVGTSITGLTYLCLS